ncbi:hypothetical protein QQ045_021746 [Rhodiola kirilowii]
MEGYRNTMGRGVGGRQSHGRGGGGRDSYGRGGGVKHTDGGRSRGGGVDYPGGGRGYGHSGVPGQNVLRSVTKYPISSIHGLFIIIIIQVIGLHRYSRVIQPGEQHLTWVFKTAFLIRVICFCCVFPLLFKLGLALSGHMRYVCVYDYEVLVLYHLVCFTYVDLTFDNQELVTNIRVCIIGAFSSRVTMTTYYNPYYYPNHQRPEISYFSVENVDGWLYELECFFHRYHTMVEQTLMIATSYLAGDAIEWYRQWYWDMQRSCRIPTWDNFSADLIRRFWSETLSRRSMILESMSKTCDGIIQLLTEMKNENSVYMSNLSKLKSHVSSISTSDFSIDKVDESDDVQTELITTELCAPVESGLVSENAANEVIVAEGVFEDSDALYLDGSIDLVLDSSRVCSVSKYFTVKSTSNLCLSDVCANASMNVPIIADDIKSLNWAFVGVLVHYDGLVERLKLIDKLEIDTIFLKKWHDGAESLFEIQTHIKLNDLRKFGCIDNINMMSELMEAGHFSESCNGLYRNVRLDCPATGKQFVVKEIFVLVLHKLVDDAFKFYKQDGSLGDSGSFHYEMRLDSGQSCDLDRNTRVSSLCGELHLDKQAAIRNTMIMVYKDVKQLHILWVWDLWDQITLKENNQVGSNENNTIIHMFRLLNIHLPVYLASIITDVSTVMVPYSKWHGKEMFKTQNLLTGVWKNKSKFQGFIISDWEGLDRSTSQTHKNDTHLVLVGKQAVSGMVLSPPLHLKTNESEDEKKTQEVLRTRFKGIYKVIKDVLDLTGVSKVELAKALAERLFDDGNFVVWIDMYGHMEKHYVTHFIGKPPGYIDHEKGSEFIEYVRKRPYNVFLFDEIEKGHHLV